jgi:hypothetical protein
MTSAGVGVQREHKLTPVSAEEAKRGVENEKFAPPRDVSPHGPKAPQPRPELAGKRLRLPGEPAIYLIDPEGLRHHVPDPYTYSRIFRDWNGVFDDPDLNEIQDAGPLSYGASVIRADGETAVYFVSGATKRHVASPAVMDKCNFKWPAGGDVVGPAVVAAIPESAPWTVPIP